ncbi:hypothetical protein [Bradyrhizobium sp.]
MADRRKITRTQTKLRVAAATRAAEEQAHVRYARIAAALSNARTILADGAFINLIRTHGVISLPQPLVTQGAPDHRSGNALASREGHLDDCALDFAITWKFFAPLLSNSAVVIDLDTRWPGFTLELRDVFIALVADGPFPYHSNGRGRRTM